MRKKRIIKLFEHTHQSRKKGIDLHVKLTREKIATCEWRRKKGKFKGLCWGKKKRSLIGFGFLLPDKERWNLHVSLTNKSQKSSLILLLSLESLFITVVQFTHTRDYGIVSGQWKTMQRRRLFWEKLSVHDLQFVWRNWHYKMISNKFQTYNKIKNWLTFVFGLQWTHS